MGKKLIYSIFVLESLKEISKFISKDSKIRAKKFVEILISKIDNLEQFPNLGKSIGNNQYMYILDNNYILIYTINKDEIYLLYIIHVKQFD